MKDEDEELLTLVPQSNSLALVYRNTKETLSFTKINISIIHQIHLTILLLLSIMRTININCF
jgi:hypothetical protein